MFHSVEWHQWILTLNHWWTLKSALRINTGWKSIVFRANKCSVMYYESRACLWSSRNGSITAFCKCFVCFIIHENRPCADPDFVPKDGELGQSVQNQAQTPPKPTHCQQRNPGNHLPWCNQKYRRPLCRFDICSSDIRILTLEHSIVITHHPDFEFRMTSGS